MGLAVCISVSNIAAAIEETAAREGLRRGRQRERKERMHKLCSDRWKSGGGLFGESRLFILTDLSNQVCVSRSLCVSKRVCSQWRIRGFVSF